MRKLLQALVVLGIAAGSFTALASTFGVFQSDFVVVAQLHTPPPPCDAGPGNGIEVAELIRR